MSWHASTWAAEFSEARLAARLVIMVIAHHYSNDEREAHPSIDTISHEARISRSSTIEAVKHLVRIGEMVIKRRGGSSRGDSNSYGLPLFDIWVQSLHPKKRNGTPIRVQNKGPVRVQNTPKDGSKVPAHRIITTSNELEQSKESPSASCEAAASPRYLAPAWAIDFLRIWNENRGLLPECRELPKGRVDKLRVRGGAPTQGSQEPSPFLGKFLEAVKRAAATPFLRGDNDRGWRCSFDYLIANDTNALEILEGKFDGGSNGAFKRGTGASRNAVNSGRPEGYDADERIRSGKTVVLEV